MTIEIFNARIQEWAGMQMEADDRGEMLSTCDTTERAVREV